MRYYSDIWVSEEASFFSKIVVAPGIFFSSLWTSETYMQTTMIFASLGSI